MTKLLFTSTRLRSRPLWISKLVFDGSDSVFRKTAVAEVAYMDGRDVCYVCLDVYTAASASRSLRVESEG